MFSTLVFKQKESTLTERKFKYPPLISNGKEQRRAGKAWLPKQQKTLVVYP